MFNVTFAIINDCSLTPEGCCGSSCSLRPGKDEQQLDLNSESAELSKQSHISEKHNGETKAGGQDGMGLNFLRDR